MKLKKSFGQHLLVDDVFLEKIADAAGAAPGMFCMEIGPGTGNLTSKLLKKGALVSAVEVDREMFPILKNKFANKKEFTLFKGDILKIDINAVVPPEARPVVAVGNLPYNISSPIIFRLLEHRHIFSAIYVMVQKEVATRMAAGPGSRDYGMLSVFCEIESSVEILFDIPPDVFKPPPDVVSSLVKITPSPARNFDIKDFETFEHTIRASFQHRRKRLLNSILLGINKGPQMEFFHYISEPEKAVSEAMASCEISSGARAEEISVDKFVAMSNYLFSLR